MRHPFWGAIVVLVAVLVLSSVAAAQTTQPRPGQVGPPTVFENLGKSGSGGSAPRRDLRGSWAGPLEPKMNEDVPPLTPLGQKLMSLNKPESKFRVAGTNDPWFTTCDPLGFPRSVVNQTRGTAFAEMPGRLVILDQYNRVWRDVWMDGRELPKNVGVKGGLDPRWFGYSVGHWDGDYTFVIDTTGSDDRSWLDTAGHPHSVNAHIQERYTRVDRNHMEMTVTVDDPKIYAKPFVLGTNKYLWIPTQETEEQFCVPSEALAYSDIIAAPAAGAKAK
jgi:hypothetical protein